MQLPDKTLCSSWGTEYQKCPNNFKIPFVSGLFSGLTVCSRFPVLGAEGQREGEERKGHCFRWYHLKKTARARCWGRTLRIDAGPV